MNERMEKVLDEIRQERSRQEIKWGQQLHNPAIWLAILSEEVGEMASGVLCFEFGKEMHREHNYRNELVQIAAVAVAAIESLDYNRSHY